MSSIKNFTDNIIFEINTIRKENKGKWYQLIKSYKYNEKIIDIKLKGFNTWLQILSINGITHESGMDISVSEFKDNIEYAIEYHL